MRPVNRGAAPRTYSKHQDACGDLRERIGWYCSYCEMEINNMIAIEHVVPVNNGGNPLDWNNFLLSCVYCNSSKSDRNISRNGYFWPDRDNTFLVFEYNQIDIIKSSNHLSPTQKNIAQATIELFQLDRDMSDIKNYKNYKDTRWQKRNEVWGVAETSLNNWHRCLTPEMAEMIVLAASGHGFFSIWMEVFKQEAEIRQRLIEAFKGTETMCFDNYTQPIARLGGNI